MNKSLSDISMRFLSEKVPKAMDDYEPRPSQIDMVQACSKIIEEGGTLLAEAGTGTGKTFAYLIPIILSGKKAIISTRTINLQEQLVSKDLRFLSAIKDVSYAIAKGRANYLCLRRLNAYRSGDKEDAEEYRSLVIWAGETRTGDREDFGSGRSSLWEKVHSDADACPGRKCSYYGRCFYYMARQRWEKAQIVVANHALVGISAMFADESGLLPKADVLVLDEAHALDHAISELIGISLSRKGFEGMINKLLRVGERGTYRGLLSVSPALFGPVESLRNDIGLFWNQVKERFKNREMIRGGFALEGQMSGLKSSVESLIGEIKTSTIGLFSEDEEIEATASIMKLRSMAAAMEIFPEGPAGHVRWAESEGDNVALKMSPVYPGDFVSGNIISSYDSVILTSATLSVAGDFGFSEKVLGLGGAEKFIVPSAFDLATQVEVSVRKGINLFEAGGASMLADVVSEESARRDGGILVLFTSRDVMRKVWEMSAGTLADMGLNPMCQGGMPNREMLELMRNSKDAVIFGLDSFWEGVDVKGDSLKSLIITKLPFEVPTDPIVLARTEEIEKNGGNPFYEYSLPKAVLKFKQGFGRLIRSKTDAGRIIICDERIETKAYGRKFFESLY